MPREGRTESRKPGDCQEEPTMAHAFQEINGNFPEGLRKFQGPEEVPGSLRKCFLEFTRQPRKPWEVTNGFRRALGSHRRQRESYEDPGGLRRFANCQDESLKVCMRRRKDDLTWGQHEGHPKERLCKHAFKGVKPERGAIKRPLVSMPTDVSAVFRPQIRGHRFRGSLSGPHF